MEVPARSTYVETALESYSQGFLPIATLRKCCNVAITCDIFPIVAAEALPWRLYKVDEGDSTCSARHFLPPQHEHKMCKRYIERSYSITFTTSHDITSSAKSPRQAKALS